MKSKETQIIVIDHMSFKTFHVVFNTAFLEICSKIFNKVTYKGNKVYVQNNLLERFKDYDNIKIYSRWIYNGDNKIGWSLRNLMGIFTNLWEYLKASYHSVICFNPANPLSFPIILLCNIILKKKVIFIVHGDLSSLKKNFSITQPSFYYKKFYYWGLKKFISLSGAYILVLGNSIKQNLISIIPQSKNNILSIYHPGTPLDIYKEKEKTSIIKKPIIIGTAGTMSDSKGLKELLLLANILSDKIKNNEIEIRCIGKVDDRSHLDNGLIKWIGYSDALSNEDFKKEVKQLDYLLYLYNPSDYDLTASGAIIDSIIYQVPFIAIRNSFFEDLFKNAIPGFFVDSVDEILSILSKILNGEQNRLFEKEFEIMKERISIDYNASLLSEQLIEENYI